MTFTKQISSPFTAILFAILINNNIHQVHCEYSKDSRSIKILNNSSSSIEVFWINAQTNELVPQFKRPIVPTYSNRLDSYTGHSFLVRQEPYINCDPNKDINDDGLIDNATYEDRFIVGIGENQVFTVEDGLKVIISDKETKAGEESEEYIQTCLSHSLVGDEYNYGQFAYCLENKVIDKLWNDNYDEIIYQTNLNARMSKYNANIACKNRHFIKKEEEDKNYYEWSHPSDNYEVEIKFKNENAKILVVDDFMSQEECLNIQKSVSIVNNDNNKSKEILNLNQSISKRMYDFAKDATGFVFNRNSLQDNPILFRKSDENKNTDDFISDPYCDGECNGKTYNRNSNDKVATMIIYCNVPAEEDLYHSDSGYSMNFNKAQVYIDDIKPGMAIFYSYVSKHDLSTDYGFTEYTECSPLTIKDGSEIIGIKHSFRPFIRN